MAKPGDYGIMCDGCKDMTAPPCTSDKPCPYFERKENEYFDEQKLERALTIDQEIRRRGGVIWVEEQLEFLRDLCEELGRDSKLGRRLAVFFHLAKPIDPRSSVDRVMEKWKDRAVPMKEAMKVGDDDVLVLGPGLVPEEDHKPGPDDDPNEGLDGGDI